MAANDDKTTGWVGWVYFAGFILLLNGMFQLILGLTALLNQDFYKVREGTLVVFDLTTWGWIHVLLGIVMMCIGTALFSGRGWARVAAIILASLNLVGHFAFMGVYPFWSITVIVIDMLILYALTVHGHEAQTSD